MRATRAFSRTGAARWRRDTRGGVATKAEVKSLNFAPLFLSSRGSRRTAEIYPSLYYPKPAGSRKIQRLSSNNALFLFFFYGERGSDLLRNYVIGGKSVGHSGFVTIFAMS